MICRSVLIAAVLLAWVPPVLAESLAPESSGGAGQEASADKSPGPAAKPVTRAPFETLMFAIDEFNDIQGRIAGSTTADEGRQAIEDASLYLSTIIYNGPKDWTIWVNDVPIGPNQDLQSFQVTSISPRYVDLLVPLSAQGMRPVRLSPNQTFITKTGAVVEGRVK
jgi:hypothetical protein